MIITHHSALLLLLLLFFFFSVGTCLALVAVVDVLQSTCASCLGSLLAGVCFVPVRPDVGFTCTISYTPVSFVHRCRSLVPGVCCSAGVSSFLRVVLLPFLQKLRGHRISRITLARRQYRLISTTKDPCNTRPPKRSCFCCCLSLLCCPISRIFSSSANSESPFSCDRCSSCCSGAAPPTWGGLCYPWVPCCLFRALSNSRLNLPVGHRRTVLCCRRSVFL